MSQVVNQAPPKVADQTDAVKMFPLPYPKPVNKEQKAANDKVRAQRSAYRATKNAEAAKATLAKVPDPKPAEAIPPSANVVAGVNQDPEADQTRNGEPLTETVTETSPVEAKPEKKLSKKQLKNKLYREKKAAELAAKEAEAPPVQTAEAPKHTPGVSAGNAVVVNYANDNTAIAEEETKVDDALASGKTMTEIGREADAEQAGEPVDNTPEVAETKSAEEVVPDTTDEGADTPEADGETAVEHEADPEQKPAEKVNEPETVATPSVQPETVAAVEAPSAKSEPKKPVLTVVTNPHFEQTDAAKKFYGSAYTEERAQALNNAVFWLDKAIAAEEVGEETKVKMAFKAALKYEAEAFGVPLEMAA